MNGLFEFSITDYGIGIPKDHLEKIFEIKDYNTRPGTSGEKGTGLGLLLCQDFVHRHGGQIWVKSEENNGSTFFFTIPFKN
jgi:signal transduction histidine kinase